MKYILFLLSLISSLYVIKARPVQKRAAFYIANETACVVDNIVYSSGDPIPTEDACESCKCRPPGFACVLQECTPKPGCRAMRKLGECCPEYVCGCEHNGKMYRDGEQIVNEKNPCYECHCQGHSIACAFVDCFYRVDCIPVYVPGACCPHYTNCSKDEPEKTLIKDNAVSPANLLPELYGSIIPDLAQPPESDIETANPSKEESSESQEDNSKESSEAQEDTSKESSEAQEDTSKESSEAQDDTSKEQREAQEDTSKEPNEVQASNSDQPDKELKIPEADRAIEEPIEKKEANDEEQKAETADETTNTPITTNAEDIKDLKEDTPTSVPTEVSTEVKVTVGVSPTEDLVTDEEAKKTTEAQDEGVADSTEGLIIEKPVQNSASSNSKSLKIARNDDLVEELMDTEVNPQETSDAESDDKKEEPKDTEEKELKSAGGIESDKTEESKEAVEVKPLGAEVESEDKKDELQDIGEILVENASVEADDSIDGKKDSEEDKQVESRADESEGDNDESKVSDVEPQENLEVEPDDGNEKSNDTEELNPQENAAAEFEDKTDESKDSDEIKVTESIPTELEESKVLNSNEDIQSTAAKDGDNVEGGKAARQADSPSKSPTDQNLGATPVALTVGTPEAGPTAKPSSESPTDQNLSAAPISLTDDTPEAGTTAKPASESPTDQNLNKASMTVGAPEAGSVASGEADSNQVSAAQSSESTELSTDKSSVSDLTTPPTVGIPKKTAGTLNLEINIDDDSRREVKDAELKDTDSSTVDDNEQEIKLSTVAETSIEPEESKAEQPTDTEETKETESSDEPLESTVGDLNE